jgi:transposase
MKPYSQDLRERLIAALEASQDSQPEVAENFGVSLSFVEKLWRRWRQTGSCAALAKAGGKKRALREDESRIRAEVVKQPDVSLIELCQRVAEAGGAAASPSMMCRELQRLDLPRKKNLSTTPNATRRE